MYAPGLPGAWKGLVTKSRDAAPWYGLWIDAANQWVAGGGANITGPAATPEWHLVTSVQNAAAGTRDLYVDAQAVANGSAAGGDGPGSLWIGGAGGVSEFFSGLIDDVRIYSRALSETDIAELSNAAIPSASLPLTFLVEPEDTIAAPRDKGRPHHRGADRGRQRRHLFRGLHRLVRKCHQPGGAGEPGRTGLQPGLSQARTLPGYR